MASFSVENMGKKIDNRWLFRGVSFSVEPGEIVCLSAPSGSGKTTLLRCLAELSVYDTGSIRLDGMTPQAYGIPQYRTKVQYLPQRPGLLPGTPRDFFERIKQFASRTNVTKEYYEQPSEIAREWDLPVKSWDQAWQTLSGGEQQRMMLAMALALQPEILLLDGEYTITQPSRSL